MRWLPRLGSSLGRCQWPAHSITHAGRCAFCGDESTSYFAASEGFFASWGLDAFWFAMSGCNYEGAKIPAVKLKLGGFEGVMQ